MKISLLHYSILTVLFAVPAVQVSAQDPFEELDAATSNEAQSKEEEQAEFRKYMQAHQAEFADYKRKLMEEFDEYKIIIQEESAKYNKELAKVWDSPEVSSKKVWVEYSKDMKTKSRVDFENQTISISTTMKAGKKPSDAELRTKLKSLLVKNQAQAFKDDPVAQAVEKKSKEKISLLATAEVKPNPILLPLVSDEEKPSEAQVDSIVDDLLEKKSQKVESNKKGDTVVTIEIPIAAKTPVDTGPSDTTKRAEPGKKPKVMVDLRIHKIPKRARTVAGDVKTFAQKAKLDHTLVFAIIETESAFNPMAKSPIPAYGLMQIVPGSAGIDATQQLFGKGKILSPSYLYASDKNIEIGSTYLNILYYRYLKGVKDPLSRLYCSISAYNTGAGNVAKAFTGSRKLRSALPKINAMTPQQVYNHLILNLPYEETREYLEKVVSRMPKYSV
jgi:membrane-bound lytic murein transglycosylase C